MIVAHIGGVPVEETLQPLMIALMLSGAWLTARAFDALERKKTVTKVDAAPLPTTVEHPTDQGEVQISDAPERAPQITTFAALPPRTDRHL